MPVRFPFIGIFLIVAGIAMVLNRLGVIYFSWVSAFWVVIAALGAVKLYNGFAAGGSASGRFWGTLFLVIGLSCFLDEAGIVWIPGRLMFPLCFVGLGLAFLLIVAGDPHRWHMLVPGLFFTGLGAVILLAELDYLSRWGVQQVVHQYWPVALILFGISLLLNRRSA